MSKVRFSGFPDGAEVTLSASGGGVSKGPVTISAWKQASGGGSDVGTMDITIHRAQGTTFAPEPVHFEAEVTGATGLPTLTDGYNPDGTANPAALYSAYNYTYDQQFHYLEFVWDFGHTGQFEFTTRHPAWLRNKNFGYGPKVSTVFETPGSKTVTCTCYRVDYDGATGEQTVTTVAQKTVTLTVADIDVAVPAEDRLYIGNVGTDFSGVPAGATTLEVDTLDTGLGSTIRTYTQTKRVGAVFFNRGDYFTYATNDPIEVGAGNTCYLGAWGSGARPILKTSPTDPGETDMVRGDGGGVNCLVAHNLEFRGGFDPVTETRDNGSSNKQRGISMRGPARSTLATVGCVFDNLNVSVYYIAMPNRVEHGTSDGVVTWDCDIRCWADYGFYCGDRGGDGTWVSLIGTRIWNHPDSCSNFGLAGKGDSGNRVEHGPHRVSAAYAEYVAQCDIVSRSGWGVLGAQPCLRLMESAAQNHRTMKPSDGDWDRIPPHIMVYGNFFENGASALSIGPVNEEIVHPMNTVIKHNIHLGGWATAGSWGVNCGGTSVIENVTIMPDVFKFVTRQNAAGPDDILIQQGRNGITGWSPLAYRELDGTGNGWIPPEGTKNRNIPVRQIGNMVIDRFNHTQDNGRFEFWDPSDVAGSSTNGVTNGLEYGYSMDFLGYTEHRDNVVYRTAGLTTDNAAGPMQATPALAIPPLLTRGPSIDWDGTRNHAIYDTHDGVDFTADAGELDLPQPQANAGVDGTATGPMSRTDIMGNERPPNASSGALEAF